MVSVFGKKGTKKENNNNKIKNSAGRKPFFFLLCRAEIVSGGRPRPAPPGVARTLVEGIKIKILTFTLPEKFFSNSI